MRGVKGIDPSGLAMSVRGFPEICYLNGLDVFFFSFLMIKKIILHHH